MLDIISMATLIIFFSSFAVFMMLIIIGGNMNKSDKEIADELEEQRKFIEDYNRKHKNKFSLIKFIKKILEKIKRFLKGRD